ncbi:MAG: type II secretion system F family protein [Candidatus Omnitrophota bacterium]
MMQKLGSKQLSQFYEHLSRFVNSGIPLERGLSIMKQGKKGPMYYLLDHLQFYVGRGGTLWEGMANCRSFFDKFQVMTIKAAEESGQVVETCAALARYYDLRNRERKRLIGSLIYPLILLHGVILLPPLKYLFVENLGKSYGSVVLPPLLIAYSLVGLAYFFWNQFMKYGKIKEIFDEILFSFPWVKKLVKGLSLARFFRAFASMHNAGIGPMQAAQQAIDTVNNQSVGRRLNGGMIILERGGTFTDFFSFSGLLQPLQLGMIAAGEETGTMQDSLDRLVNLMEEENRKRLIQTAKGLGVMAYLIAALVVAMTVISFYGKLFSVSY